jgi:hypothetical protein
MAENASMIDERVQNKEEDAKKNNVLQKIAESKTGKDVIRHMNTLHATGKNILFNDILFEMFSNSLLLDTSFVSENSVSLKGYLDNYLADRGGFNLLESAIGDTDSVLLKSIKKLCEATATKVCNRKMTEDADHVTIFSVNDTEKESFDYGKKDLDMSSLSDLVKQKVLTVVQDEKEKTEQRQQFMDDLQNELSGSQDDEIGEADIAESASRIVTKNTKELPSLFEALMTNSYKELLENIGGMQSHQMKRRKMVKDYDTEMDEDDAGEDEHEDLTLPEVEDENDEDEVKEDDNDRHGRRLRRRYRGGMNTDEACACENAIDMDMVMAEAITKYTVLELFNTLKLETITTTSKKKLIQSLVH